MTDDSYLARAERYSGIAEAHGARSRLVSNLRGLAFGLAVVSALFAIFGQAPLVAALASAAAAVAFIALVVWHARVIEAEDAALRSARVNRFADARAHGRFRELPATGARFADARHPYSDDLDVFGPGSLFQRLSVAHTRFGEQTLADWLRAPAPVAEIRERQEAARALAPELELRQRLEALALAVVDADGGRPERRASEPPDPEPLLRWAEAEPELTKNALLIWAARLLPVLTIGGMIAAGFGLPAALWGAPLIVQLLLAFKTREETTRVFLAVSSTEGAFLRYGAMLELLEQVDVQAPALSLLRERLISGPVRPSASMKAFRSLVGWYDVRHNGLVHPFINAIFLWDLNCTLALERWQLTSGRAARGWFEALGRFEALSSLAGLLRDEPSFVMPELTLGPACFEAEALGHPLIADEARVSNDVSLSLPGTALLVTGSNMSGKSTMLRAMGLATVMALAGAPVCARRFRVAHFAVRTSIRVSDSLGGGVSHFYAEVAKLKAVLDATAGDDPVLFLLDEVLHGTNSRERQIGARWVLRELLERGATGAASTHDMGLAELPAPLMERVTLVHFREQVSDGRMTFDYKLRPGPVVAGNALRLMRLVGLEVPLE